MDFSHPTFLQIFLTASLPIMGLAYALVGGLKLSLVDRLQIDEGKGLLSRRGVYLLMQVATTKPYPVAHPAGVRGLHPGSHCSGELSTLRHGGVGTLVAGRAKLRPVVARDNVGACNQTRWVHLQLQKRHDADGIAQKFQILESATISRRERALVIVIDIFVPDFVGHQGL